jgi:hypothetical protein
MERSRLDASRLGNPPCALLIHGWPCPLAVGRFVFEEFLAPAGATRLALGIPDGFGFGGVPGAYDDNDGAYRIRVGIDEIPTNEVPIPAALPLFATGLGLLGLAGLRRRRRKA